MIMMKVVVTNNKVKILRTYLEHQSDIEFRFYKVTSDAELYKKIKIKNKGTQYENAIEIPTFNPHDYSCEEDFMINEVIAMIDNVDDIIYINMRGYMGMQIISDIHLANQPISFVHHVDDLDKIPTLILNGIDDEGEYRRLSFVDTYNYRFSELDKAKQLVDVDEQTKQYRLIPHIEDKESFEDVENICENVLHYVLNIESRHRMYQYKPYNVTLQREPVREHNSRIVRQMAEVGNIRHIFENITENEEEPITHDTLPNVDWKGDLNRVFVHQENKVIDYNIKDYNETTIYGHYKDVQALVESDEFHNYYDKSKEVQMSFKNLSNGLVVVKLYQFNIKDLGNKYRYFGFDNDGFQTNQIAFAFCRNGQFEINDLNQEARRNVKFYFMNGNETKEVDAETKLKFTAFRQHLEKI